MKSKPMKQAARRVVLGQPSWRLASAEVEAFVTETGGHLGPVTFDRKGGKFRPYSVAPWAEETVDPSLPPILKVLRGDFFCLPFGGNANPYRGEKHPVHGETANLRWRFESLQAAEGRRCLHLSLKTKTRAGRVDKRIWLVDGQNTIYCRHVITGMNGRMSFGHHAMLRFPGAPGSGVISTSRFVYGQVFPGILERPENRGYTCLKPAAEFRSLGKVPTLTGEATDLSRYPSRRGFEDIVMLVSDPSPAFAWTAVTFRKSGYVWFGLKNPRILPETVFWFSNGGRHYPPWNGRHVAVLGLEEVCSYFHPGLAESVQPNPISRKGYPTCVTLSPSRPTVIPYIMGVARVPAGFDRVASILPVRGKQAVVLKSSSGRKAEAAVALDFLDTMSPPGSW